MTDRHDFEHPEPMPPAQEFSALEQARFYNAQTLGIHAAATLFDQDDLVAQHALAREARLSDQQAQTAEMRHIAYHDELTGLLNRRGLSAALESLPSDAKFGALYADITNFKAINDLITHDRGDVFLKSVSDMLKDSVRTHDLVSRIGGDEFLIVITDQHQGNNRRQERPLHEQLELARQRIGSAMLNVLEKNHDAQVLGVHLAIGRTPVGRTGDIDALKTFAEADMKLHKTEQHNQFGKHRTV